MSVKMQNEVESEPIHPVSFKWRTFMCCGEHKINLFHSDVFTWIFPWASWNKTCVQDEKILKDLAALPKTQVWRKQQREPSTSSTSILFLLLFLWSLILFTIHLFSFTFFFCCCCCCQITEWGRIMQPRYFIGIQMSSKQLRSQVIN